MVVDQAGGRSWINQRNVVLYDRAIDHFTATIGRSPTAEAYHQRGVVLATMGQYEKAVADFDAVIARDSKNMAAYNERGNALRKLGKAERAIADFSKVIDSKIRHPAIYTNRGLTWHDMGEHDRALADYNAAIQIDAKFAPAYAEAGQFEEAVKRAKEAIGLASDSEKESISARLPLYETGRPFRISSD